MNYNDLTQMVNGGNAKFMTTQWTEIARLDHVTEQQRRDHLGVLLQKYWLPVFYYLKQKGLSSDRAKDMVQEFYLEIVMGKSLISQADRSKGKFRTFILTALDRFLISQHRKETAQKRAPSENIVPLDLINPETLASPSKNLSPMQVFNQVWASELLSTVVLEVQENCNHTGKSLHWAVFQARVLDPIMTQNGAPSLPELKARFGIETEAKISNMIVTVKRRFQISLMKHLKLIVENNEDIDDEIGRLIQSFTAK